MTTELLTGLRHSAPVSPVPHVGAELPLGHSSFKLFDLVRFAKWNRSESAVDLVARRLTADAHGWPGLRAIVVTAAAAHQNEALDRITTAHLFALWDALSSVQDVEAESAIAREIVRRHINGEQLDRKQLTQLESRLLFLGRWEDAQSIVESLPRDSWLRAVAVMELAHPRFGGSHQTVIDHLNEVYRSAGLARVHLADGSGSAFSRLASVIDRRSHGPVVTVIMSAWRPGEEILTAIRSVINQTYQDWELIVSDDASGHDYDELFEQVGALDPRIRVIRNPINAGTYVRRNEALKAASGTFITFHDSDDWSHPERLEIQVNDLVSHPGRIGNIIRHARATDDLSFATNRGMTLGLTEPAIMFRREEAISTAGFYDPIRKGADREYRLRLEIVTGSKVELVGPMAPLQLMLASESSLSGSDFGPGWMTAARVAYRHATDRFHARVKAGLVSGRVDYPQPHRLITAPPDLASAGGAKQVPVDVDVLVVADGRSSLQRDGFLRQMSLEIRHALDAGLSVGLLHSDSIGGVHGGPRLDPALQTLLDDREVVQVFDDQPTRAELVVVRHAAAIQSHPLTPRPIITARVVVVEDPSSGDIRGRTFNMGEVITTATSWFGTAPRWGTFEELEREAVTVARLRREPIVLGTFKAPSSQLKYEDQSVASPSDDLSFRFQQTFSRFAGVDVVFGVGSMDSYLNLNHTSTPTQRLERTRRFVRELTASRTALVRAIFDQPSAESSQQEAEARALLDRATTRFVLPDGVGSTPDPARTTSIPYADPTPLFVGYPVRERVPGRIIVLASATPRIAISALSVFFATRVPELSLRVIGATDETLSTALERATARTPGRVTSRLGLTSDAALVEEITAAELVVIPEINTPIEYQLAMSSLALGRPIATPNNGHATALRDAVGNQWVRMFSNPLTAEQLDLVVTQSRQHPTHTKPDLSQRELALVEHRYTQLFLEVAHENRASLRDVSDDSIDAAAAV